MLKSKEALSKNTLGSKKRGKKDDGLASTDLIKGARSDKGSEFRSNLGKAGRSKAHKESASSIYGALVHGKGGSKQNLKQKQQVKNNRRKVTGTKSFSSDRHSSASALSSDSEARRARADYSASASSNSEPAHGIRQAHASDSSGRHNDQRYGSRSDKGSESDQSDRHQTRTVPRQAKDRSVSRRRDHDKVSHRADDRDRGKRTRNTRSPLNDRLHSTYQEMSGTNATSIRGKHTSVQEELQRQIQLLGVENVMGALSQFKPGQQLNISQQEALAQGIFNNTNALMNRG